ncbi:hypothetical protein ACU8KO_002612 [Vibrio alginolyticus]
MNPKIREKLEQWRDKCATGAAQAQSGQQAQSQGNSGSSCNTQLQTFTAKIKRFSPSCPMEMDSKDLPPLM